MAQSQIIIIGLWTSQKSQVLNTLCSKYDNLHLIIWTLNENSVLIYSVMIYFLFYPGYLQKCFLTSLFKSFLVWFIKLLGFFMLPISPVSWLGWLTGYDSALWRYRLIKTFKYLPKAFIATLLNANLWDYSWFLVPLL